MIPLLKNVRSTPGIHAVDMLVEQTAPRELTVRAGGFRVVGIDHVLAADQSYGYTQRPEVTWLIGYLVRAKADGSISLLVDEFAEDGADVMYAFGPDSSYDLLHNLFVAKLPGNVPNLDAVTVEIVRMIEGGS